jgi:tRNA-specific 2-thiouridylase
VSQHYHEDHHTRNRFTITNCNWFLDESPLLLANQSLFGKIRVKLRHGPEMQTCAIFEGGKPDEMTVILIENDQGIAPGQYAAFYRDDLCLGSGVIC